MNKKQTLKETREFVRERLHKEATGHDYWHIDRVLRNARLINKSEGADVFVVELAILLHDVGDRKAIHKDADDYSIAENFLNGKKVPADILDHVMFIIKNMSFSNSFGKRQNTRISREFAVVQDADRLDAVGAIGISRAFSYGGNRNRPIYDPNVKVKKFLDKKRYQSAQSSSIHHFHEKLFLLKDLMNTATARKIAAKRDKYMRDFLKQFLLEWEGKR